MKENGKMVKLMVLDEYNLHVTFTTIDIAITAIKLCIKEGLKMEN
jgi:hypothetical protein